MVAFLPGLASAVYDPTNITLLDYKATIIKRMFAQLEKSFTGTAICRISYNGVHICEITLNNLNADSLNGGNRVDLIDFLILNKE